jgi:rod shape-determining protein MreB
LPRPSAAGTPTDSDDLRLAYGLFSNDLAIDLGTRDAHLREGQGHRQLRALVVAVQRDARGDKKVLAVGREAKEMLGGPRATSRRFRPLRDGVIADFEITEAMLRYFIARAHNRRTLVKPRIIICVPFGITEVEKGPSRKRRERRAREVYLIEEPMAAAIGAGCPYGAERQHGGRYRRRTTEVAVISLAVSVLPSVRWVATRWTKRSSPT